MCKSENWLSYTGSAQTIVSKEEEKLFAAILIVLLAPLNSSSAPNVNVRMKNLQLQMGYGLSIIYCS